MSREDLLQYAITTAEENRLLRMTSLTQNIPSKAKLREREKAKTGEEARRAILAKRAAAQAAEEKKRKEASRKRKREQNEMRKKEMKRRRKEERGQEGTETAREGRKSFAEREELL